MGIPWLLALRAIPWVTILAKVPEILRSADAPLSGAKVHAGAAASRNDLQALADRIAMLEQRDRETAELLRHVTAQIAALATAGRVLEARARWLFVVAVATSAVALLACALALFAR